MRNILRAFRIPRKHYEDFRILVEEGAIPNEHFGRKLACVDQYHACLEAILRRISEPIIRQHQLE